MDLETKVGGRLFDRTSRRVQLTPLGEELRQRTAPAYEQLQRACVEVGDLARGVAGMLRLGVYMHAAGEPYLMQIVRMFESRHPSCRVRVTETDLTHDPLDRLRRDELDELDVLVLRPVTDPEIQVGPVLDRQARLLAVAVDHQLAGRASVDVEDLADYITTDLPVLSREIMDELSPPQTPSGRPIERAELHSIAEAVVRVATGELVHPTVAAFFEAYPNPGVTAIPIRDLPPVQARTRMRDFDLEEVGAAGRRWLGVPGRISGGGVSADTERSRPADRRRMGGGLRTAGLVVVRSGSSG